MSPTSYQTAPPRSSIIINGLRIVKLRQNEHDPMFLESPLIARIRVDLRTGTSSSVSETLRQAMLFFLNLRSTDNIASDARFFASNRPRIL